MTAFCLWKAMNNIWRCSCRIIKSLIDKSDDGYAIPLSWMKLIIVINIRSIGFMKLWEHSKETVNNYKCQWRIVQNSLGVVVAVVWWRSSLFKHPSALSLLSLNRCWWCLKNLFSTFKASWFFSSMTKVMLSFIGRSSSLFHNFHIRSRSIQVCASNIFILLIYRLFILKRA